MATLFVRHTVSDYAAWRKLYDTFAPIQKQHGVTAQAVYQSADNPNDVTVTHEFASVASAQAFMAIPELKQAMQKAGVVGAPTAWIANKA
jgi:quinol monooxygenase YgiN